jgi:chemotaxis protein CheD
MLAASSRINIIQGEYHVSDDPNLVISTLLGSCIATCIYDPVARVGGMNHFLLPGEAGPHQNAHAARYGVHLMELLINGLLKIGGVRNRFEAKIFGGANTVKGLGNIGTDNVKFAQDFLAAENIVCTGGSVGGDQGRRLQFFPTTGKAKQMLVVSVQPAQPPARRVDVLDQSGELDLF